eukprot:SAG31_NODE_3446_length_4259_cov_3.747115_2_plen_205_part_00
MLDDEGATARNGATDTAFEEAGVMNPAGRDPNTGMRMVFDYKGDSILRQHHESLLRLGTSYGMSITMCAVQPSDQIQAPLCPSLRLRAVDSLVLHDLDLGYHATALSPPGLVEKHLADLRSSGFPALRKLRQTGDIKAIGAGLNWESRNFEHWVGTRGHTPMEKLVENIAEREGDLDFLLLAGPYHLLDTRALDSARKSLFTRR